MIGLGLYKFGRQAVPVSNRHLYMMQYKQHMVMDLLVQLGINDPNTGVTG